MRTPVPLNRSGDGARTVGFDRRTTAYVELSLVNTSTRFTCARRTYLTLPACRSTTGSLSGFAARVTALRGPTGSPARDRQCSSTSSSGPPS